MDAFLLIALIVIIILLYNIRNSQNALTRKNEQDFRQLQKQFQELKKLLPVIEEKKESDKVPEQDPLRWRPRPHVSPEEPREDLAPAIPEKNQPEEKFIPVSHHSTSTLHHITKPFAPLPKEESWSQRWLKNNPDLEKFIGENLVNKIGITVLVLGIAFFVKYAIDQDWINETGRVCIGIACGIGLVGIAHFMRNSYRSFSSVMAGGGIAVFYFTIAFAYHQYHLFDQTVAFIIMVIITVFAVAISLLYDKIELAVIALIGGFLAPFLVSSGSGNYIVLFSYLLILSSGTLLIAYFKKWQLLVAVSFFFSWLIFNGWLIKDYAFGTGELPFRNALFFSSAFYGLFLVATMINNLRTQKPFKAFDFSLLLTITFSYYGQGMYILSYWNDGAYQGLFTMALGFINLCLAWYLFKTQKGERNLLYLLIGLTLTFISLVAPVQLKGHSITLFWSAECVLLYWLHQRSGIKIFKLSSILILICMAFSLMTDWSLANERGASFLPLIFLNWQGFLTNIVATIALALYSFLLYKEEKEVVYAMGIKANAATRIFATAAVLVFYFTCLFSVNLYFSSLESFLVPNAYHQLITYIFGIIAIEFLTRDKAFKSLIVPGLITAACIMFYLASAGYSSDLVLGVISNRYSVTHAIIHWISVSALTYLLYSFISVLRKNAVSMSAKILWPFCLVAVTIISMECRLLYISAFADPGTIRIYISNYSKAGLTIIWAIFSFVTIWLGMRFKNKTLRIIALSIFTIALLKLFLFDIRNISEAGKIAAFIMLGILLLIISFMYQRLKKMIIDNEGKTN